MATKKKSTKKNTTNTSVKRKQYIGISRDHSGSMYSIARAALKDYNNQIQTIKDLSNKYDIDTYVSTVICDTYVKNETFLTEVSLIKPLSYYGTGGQTPLFDSVMELVRIMKTVPDYNDPNVTFFSTGYYRWCRKCF